MLEHIKRLFSPKRDSQAADELVCNRILEAVESHDVSTVESMLNENPHLIQSDYGGGGWMNAAVYESDTEMVRMLLRLGCDVNTPDGVGATQGTPVSTAIGCDDVEMVQLLLDSGGAPTTWDLIGAITGDHAHSLQLVKLLEAYGVDLHGVEVDSEDEPTNALVAAVRWGKEDVYDYLISKNVQSPFDDSTK